MTNDYSNRPDNLLGVCHRIGEVFGFNPLILRLALAIGVVVNFELTIALYLAAGLVVLADRLIAGRASSRQRIGRHPVAA